MSRTVAQDEKWMRRALDLARQGVGLTRPNPPVGAVVVKGGRLLAEGYHRAAGRPHAEAVALEKAGRDARHATLYVTLEPCCTWGRTGPCTKLILSHRLNRVVVATRDPNPVHQGAGIGTLQKAGMEVIEGVCREDAEELIAPFSKWVRSGTPYLTLKLAMSLDGKIADRSGRSRWITGTKARGLVHDLRRSVDAIMVGAGTAVSDDPQLLPRPAHGRKPFRVIVDDRGRTPYTVQLLNDRHANRTIIATGKNCPPQRRKGYERKGAEVIVLPQRRGGLSLGRLFDHLGERGFLHVLCEGGGELAEGLVRADLVDEYVFFLGSCLIGGREAVGAIGGRGWPLSVKPQVEFLSCEHIGKDILVRAKPLRNI